MKSILLLTLVLLTYTTCKNLKENKDINNSKQLNPNSVKSPGEFSNVAPDANNIVRPIYASK